MVLAAVLSVATPVAASPFTFFDGFEGEASAGSVLNYGGFVNWNVTDGTVDFIKSGDFGITCRSGSFCVDLDGTTRNAGVLGLAAPISIAAGDFVDIVSWISGNQRTGATDEVNITILFSVPVALSNFQFLSEIGYGPRSTSPRHRVSICSGSSSARRRSPTMASASSLVARRP